MKKQTDPQIKAHLLRSAFYLLLLLAVGVIPFALGQRSGANKQSVVTAPLLSGSTRDATLLDAECPPDGTWSFTGSLNTQRIYHTMTLLNNGQVLVAGGNDNNSNVLASVELYDPATGSWTYTGSLNQPHYSHTATLLPNGMVLVAGSTDNYSFESAELYDPDSGTWSVTGSLNHPRYYHTATLLPNGKVLIAGGYYFDAYIAE